MVRGAALWSGQSYKRYNWFQDSRKLLLLFFLFPALYSPPGSCLNAYQRSFIPLITSGLWSTFNNYPESHYNVNALRAGFEKWSREDAMLAKGGRGLETSGDRNSRHIWGSREHKKISFRLLCGFACHWAGILWLEEERNGRIPVWDTAGRTRPHTPHHVIRPPDPCVCSFFCSHVLACYFAWINHLTLQVSS